MKVIVDNIFVTFAFLCVMNRKLKTEYSIKCQKNAVIKVLKLVSGILNNLCKFICFLWSKYSLN